MGALHNREQTPNEMTQESDQVRLSSDIKCVESYPSVSASFLLNWARFWTWNLGIGWLSNPTRYCQIDIVYIKQGVVQSQASLLRMICSCAPTHSNGHKS